jgi:type IV pilus assembly protein PilP
MKNSIATMRALFCLIAAMLLLVGCDEPDKTAAQPQTVRKKITAKAETGPPPATTVAAPAQPAPAAAAGEKPVLAQVATPQTPPPVPGPPPEPKEPPPTQAPALPLQLAQAPTAIQSSPPNDAKPLSLDGNPQQSGMAADDSQIAALLNVHAPPPYNPKGKVDPFAPLLRDESAAVKAGQLRVKDDPKRAKTPLEKFDLGQLKLTAIIEAPASRNRAVFEEASGKGYIITEGTYIGLNSGKVVGIEADKVLIEEEFEDIYGKTITQKKEITLPKPPGEL